MIRVFYVCWLYCVLVGLISCKDSEEINLKSESDSFLSERLDIGIDDLIEGNNQERERRETNESLPLPWSMPFLFGVEGVDQALGLDLLPNHDVVIAGRTEGVLADREEVGLADGFVALIKNSGELGWIKQFGTPDLDQFLDLIYHPQGLIIAGGLSTGDYAGEPNTQLMDGILVALNVNGNTIWEKKLDLGTVNRLFPTPNGVVVVGSYEETSGDPAAFIAHYTLEGEREWLTSLNSPAFDSATSVTSVDDHLYVSGFTFGSIRTQESRSDMNMFVAKLSLLGELIWIKEYGGVSDDSAVRIIHDQEGLVVAGYTGGLFGREQYGSNDVAVLRLDFNGEVIWQSQFGTAGSESAYGATFGQDGHIILGGRIDEASWDRRLNQNGDAFLLELSAEGEQLNVIQFGSNGRDEVVDVLYKNGFHMAGYLERERTGSDLLVDRWSSLSQDRIYP